MQALVLAGGLGTRLRPLTNSIPKPMMPILGKPFLSYQLELLKSSGISEVVLSIGYLGEQIKAYFGDGSKMGLRVTYSIEEVPMGTAGGMKLASSLLHDEFFVVYGDSYLPVDYKEVEDFFKDSGKIGLLIAYDDQQGETTVRRNVSIGENNLVTKYKKDSNDKDLNLVEAGVLVFKKRVLDFIPESKPFSLENEIFPVLIAKKELAGFITNQRFYDIGMPERLKDFEELFK